MVWKILSWSSQICKIHKCKLGFTKRPKLFVRGINKIIQEKINYRDNILLLKTKKSFCISYHILSTSIQPPPLSSWHWPVGLGNNNLLLYLDTLLDWKSINLTSRGTLFWSCLKKIFDHQRSPWHITVKSALGCTISI